MATFHQLGDLAQMETTVLVLISSLMVVVPCVEVRSLTLDLHPMVKVAGSSANNFELNVGMQGAVSVHFLNFYYSPSALLYINFQIIAIVDVRRSFAGMLPLYVTLSLLA